ncbi:hypothetical protein JCM10213_007605 [Rhodosporidiobolus nylandii]
MHLPRACTTLFSSLLLLLSLLPLVRAAQSLSIEYLELAYDASQRSLPLSRSTQRYRCQLHPVYIQSGLPPFAVDVLAADDRIFNETFAGLKDGKEAKVLASVVQNGTERTLLWGAEDVEDMASVVLRVTDAGASTAYTLPRTVRDASPQHRENPGCFDTSASSGRGTSYFAWLGAVGVLAGIFVCCVWLARRRKAGKDRTRTHGPWMGLEGEKARGWKKWP